MKPLLKSLARFGNLLRKNQGKIALALGVIAAAEAIRFLRAPRAPRLRETGARHSDDSRVRPAVAADPSDRGKRAIYRAPQIPPQALVKH